MTAPISTRRFTSLAMLWLMAVFTAIAVASFVALPSEAPRCDKDGNRLPPAAYVHGGTTETFICGRNLRRR